MRTIFPCLPVLLAVAGCTTVIQEPADLDESEVRELEITQGDETNVRIVSDTGWQEAGIEIFVRNRLTQDLVTTSTAADGALDVTVAGRASDAFAVSRIADGALQHQITAPEGETIPAWGWGFGGPSGCEPGAFVIGLIHPPQDGATEYDTCSSQGELTTFGDAAVVTVGTDDVRLEMLELATLRFRVLIDHLDHDTAVHASLVAEGPAGDGGEYVGIVAIQPEATGTWVTYRMALSQFDGPGVHPHAGMIVRGIWLWAQGPRAADSGFAVDDVVLERAVQIP